MSEAAAIRYLISKGWAMIEDGWFVLKDAVDNEPVCIETAYYMQKNAEQAAA